MVHVPTLKALRALGAQVILVKCAINYLQNMSYYNQTAYGESDHFCQSDPTDPLQGGGQGNPAVPQMWVTLSVIILIIFNMYEHGVKIEAIFTRFATAKFTFDGWI